jgi:hypothetical protein
MEYLVFECRRDKFGVRARACRRESDGVIVYRIPTKHGPFPYDQNFGCDYAYASFVATTVMTLNPESKYPNRRAYVLKMRSDAKPGALAGRLENLVTGEQRDFASGGELLESIAIDLEVNVGGRSTDATPK